MACLQEAGVTSWKIQPRINIANTYPSDFDVVQVIVFSVGFFHRYIDIVFSTFEFLFNETIQLFIVHNSF